jgi:hypothetical protein
MPCAWAAAAGANRTADAAKRSAKALRALFMMFTSTRTEGAFALRNATISSALLLNARLSRGRVEVLGHRCGIAQSP